MEEVIDHQKKLYTHEGVEILLQSITDCLYHNQEEVVNGVLLVHLVHQDYYHQKLY